jgi:hypothetical protein
MLQARSIGPAVFDAESASIYRFATAVPVAPVNGGAIVPLDIRLAENLRDIRDPPVAKRSARSHGISFRIESYDDMPSSHGLGPVNCKNRVRENGYACARSGSQR